MNKALSLVDIYKVHTNPEKPFKSRYEEDFVEIEKLGRGGYGAVYKVQNKLDGLLYALKMIQFKNSSSQLLEKVLREVKTLALLHHSNIVRYHTAWLEEDDNVSAITPDLHDSQRDKCKYQEQVDSSFSECNDFSESTDDSMDQFNPFRYDDIHNWDHHRQPFDHNHAKPLPNASNPLKISQRNVPTPFSKRAPSSGRRSSMVNVTTLFIVMQLYSTTLSQWLDERPQVDSSQNVQIFRQICKGLQYIHSRGVIHRDLKPGNIFLSRTLENSQLGDFVVCLGDFGLAIHNGAPQTSPTSSPVPSPLFPSSLSPSPNSDSGSSANGHNTSASPLSFSAPSLLVVEPPSSSILGRSWEAKKHTSAVGTLTYSSPEQRFKGIYNEKTDIFSLGIIFFELYYTCSTKMEKARVLSDLRNRIIPPAFLNKYPTESAFILSMLLPNPDDRPSVDELLASDLLAEEYMTVHRKDILDLETTVHSQRNVIQQQEEHIRMLEQKLAALASSCAHDKTTVPGMMQTV